MNRWIKPLLLTIFSLILTIACQNLLISRSHSLTKQSTPAECRVVQHMLGETCVPVEPKRIVALDPIFILDPLLSLGVKPVGAAADGWREKRTWGGLPPEEAAKIEVVGQSYLPSLEKLLMVKPDLILGLTDVGQYYPQLSAIAPTVLMDYYKEVKFSFKEHLRSIAHIVNREADAEKVLGQYQERIATLKAQLARKLEGKEISVIYYSDGNFWAPSRDAVFFQILNDIGMRIKPIFPEASATLVPTFSIEVIDKYDADILIICNDDDKPKSFFLKNRVIASLKAAQNRQIYIMDGGIWRAFGPIVIDRIVDDLSKSLLEAVATFE